MAKLNRNVRKKQPVAKVSAPKSNQQPDREFFRTPPEVTQALLDREDFEGTILDPVAGMLDMTKVLRGKYPKSVDASDLYKYDGFRCKTGVDFLKATKEYDCIIMNPPFRQIGAFVKQALKLARKKVAVLCQASFGTQATEGKILENPNFPLKSQYIFRTPIRWLNNPKATNRFKIAFFVFERDIRGRQSGS